MPGDETNQTEQRLKAEYINRHGLYKDANNAFVLIGVALADEDSQEFSRGLTFKAALEQPVENYQWWVKHQLSHSGDPDPNYVIKLSDKDAVEKFNKTAADFNADRDRIILNKDYKALRRVWRSALELFDYSSETLKHIKL